MPRKNSQAGQFREWEALLREVRNTEAELPGAAQFVATLERAHAEAVFWRVVRDGLLRAARSSTQELNETCATGRDAAIALRSFVKSVLGYRNEKLVRYGVKPQRKRAVRKKIPVM
jgi:hypothetical protein